ncbi:MAG: acylphosphatase [Solirubrobacteraceae bacterium]
MSADTIRKHLVVHGKVQGVFFRDSVREKAENEGVSGWVANRDDGAVELVAEGPTEAVEEVINYARRGPASAHVERVDEHDEDPQGLDGFEVR